MSDDRRDYSVSRNDGFSSISTEELENLIGNLLLDSNADYELMNELLEVYETRDGVPEIDIDAAWERFTRDYSGQGEIYLTEDADNPIQTSSRGRLRRRRRLPKHLLRYSLITAAVLAFIVLPVTGVNTYAYSLSALRSIVQWTRENFWFNSEELPAQANEELAYLYDALEEHGITERLLPTWIPEGYSLADQSIFELASGNFFYARFKNEKNALFIQISIPSDSTSVQYEWSGENISSYNRNGIEHHIMMNEGKVCVAWTNMSYECIISGDITVDDVRRMINSIYER